MNEKDPLHHDEKEVMIQVDFEKQTESSSDDPNTDKVETCELMCITFTLKRFQQTCVDGH